jgi:ribosomal protein L7/L12
MTKCRFCDHNVPLGTYLCPNCGAPVDTTTPQVVEDLEQQVRSLLGQGQKIEAIKLYKGQTGASLMESKNAVEAIQRGESPKNPPEPDRDMEAELLRLLEGGKKLEAVKIYKQRTGVQLIQAKQAVEALATKKGIVPKGGGCVGVLAAIVVAAVVVGMMIQ